MAGLSEFPDIIKGLFLNDRANNNGFYALNLFIRGKPWTVVVDDIFLFEKDRFIFPQQYKLKSALVGDDKSLWGPIVEKAWAKIKGNYDTINLGLLKNGIRVLTGAPVFDRFLSDNGSLAQYDSLFNELYDAS